jgi:hypothetical protein
MSQSKSWQPIETTPKDGSEITVRMLEWEARVYWDDDLKTWVLVSPMHLESVSNPKEWRK